MSQTLPFVFGLFILQFNMVLNKRLQIAPKDFPMLLLKGNYVDKTLLIKLVFDMPKKLLITAPKGWGKSTNIEMMKTFLKIEVNEEGIPVSQLQWKKRGVNDTGNFIMFSSNALEITQHKYTMRKSFGRFPVLHIDFKCSHRITNSENAVLCFREVIHNAFKEHEYLKKSLTLTMKERRLVTTWSDYSGAYERFYGQDVTNSLYKLALLLYKHFERRKVFVLIDNYDHPTTSAMFEVKDSKELDRVIRYNMGIIAKLLSGDYKYIGRAFILGVSYVNAAGIYKLDDVRTYRFLADHQFVRYFGLTKREVGNIFRNSNPSLNRNLRSAAHLFYGGYTSLNMRTMYSLHSFFNFMSSYRLRNYVFVSLMLENINRILKIHNVRNQFELLVKGGTICLDMYEMITIEDIIALRNVVTMRRSEEHFNTNLIFYFLLEQGYLSYDIENNEISNHNLTSITIPNLEIRNTIASKIKEYYDGLYKLDRTIIGKCASFFDDFSPALNANRVQLQRSLYWFYTSVEEFIWKTKSGFSKLSLFDIPRLIFSITYQVNLKNSNTGYVKVEGGAGPMEVMLVNDKFKFFFSLRLNESSMCALKQSIQRCNDSMFDEMKTDGRKYVSLGLNVDGNLRPSVSCLPNSLNLINAIHIPDIR